MDNAVLPPARHITDLAALPLSQSSGATFPKTPDTHALNILLSPMIQKMLEQKLWRFNAGLPGEQGYYTIDPAFADKCYEIEGSRLFGRLGHPVWEAFRKQAEQWRKEKHSGKKTDNKLHKVQASQLRGDEPMQVVIDSVSILLSA